MFKYLAMVSLVSLYGCSAGISSEVNNYTAEQSDAAGVTLFASTDMYVSFPEISQIYALSMQCIGMTADGPDIYYKSFSKYFNGAVGSPWAFFRGGTIYINTDTIGPSFPRDARTDTEALRHEFVHHIMWANGANWKHTNPMFAQCGKGVNTYN